ncbi:MAG: hypothetical protein A2285_09430 [Elusimicrobia bacterium RIFOXYA12_FULL_57_11]|nr:MAG: hypothetical protein A2285_09430 [Elusimicrobia bacterium RIFOXYA12_FULL_57_11]
MTTTSRAANPTLLLLLAIFLFIFTMMVWPYLVSLMMGIMLAILTRPLYEVLARKRLAPRTAASVAIIAIMFAIIVPLVLFAALAVKQGIALSGYLADERGAMFLRSAVDGVMGFKPLYYVIESPAALQAKGIQFLQSAGAALSTVILVKAATLPDLALKLVLSMLTWYFMLVEGNIFFNWAMDKAQLERTLRARLGKSFKDTVASTVWATSAAAAAQAVIVMLGFLLLGVPGVFLASGATFIFAWIPILGSLPVCLAGAVYLYFKGSIIQVVFMGVVAVGAGLIDNVVRPIVLKGHGDMHPLLALVAIFSGIGMFGILGVIFGPIVAAMLVSILNAWAPSAEPV